MKINIRKKEKRMKKEKEKKGIKVLLDMYKKDASCASSNYRNFAKKASRYEVIPYSISLFFLSFHHFTPYRKGWGAEGGVSSFRFDSPPFVFTLNFVLR